jgi:hypothetical protein
MIADREQKMLRSELFEVIIVFMAVVSLRFDFCFGFSDGFVFCARSCAYAKKPPETRHDFAAF